MQRVPYMDSLVNGQAQRLPLWGEDNFIYEASYKLSQKNAMLA